MDSFIAIDPGEWESGWVIFNNGELADFGLLGNPELLQMIEFCNCDYLVVEVIQNYGMSAGESIHQTSRWTGRFIQSFCQGNEEVYEMVTRPEVLKQLKISSRSSKQKADTKVRQEMIDRYGGKQVAVGLKKTPGPLYGMKDDTWQALGLAHAFLDRKGKRNANI